MVGVGESRIIQWTASGLGENTSQLEVADGRKETEGMRQHAGTSSRSFREEEIWARLGFYCQLAAVAPLEVIQAWEWHWSLSYQKTLGIPWDMSCANPAPLCPTLD